LIWATVTTALGSVTALVLARGLLEAFRGKGLVPPEVVADPVFPMAVALAAGMTVLLATRLGLPVSTTHALIGGLVGAGLVASADGVSSSRLLHGFFLPLLTSPILAVGLAALVYPLLRSFRRGLGVSEETCICVREEPLAVMTGNPGIERTMTSVRWPTLAVKSNAACRAPHDGTLAGVGARPLLDAVHFLTAGAVSFARGLNDTPKIAALLLVAGTVAPGAALTGVGLVMAVGGWFGARRVAETMSLRVTEMNSGQGLTANVVTALLVIGASRFGLPVSTTHVSCGSLFGIGTATRRAHWGTIGGILLAWAVTLPMAGLLGALFVAMLG
jgi:PiT family inorganic phosphate transporter